MRGAGARLLAAGVIVSGLAVATAAVPADARAAAAPSRTAQAASGPDYCTTDEGVTVVVDLSDLGGSIIVRCVDEALPSNYTGWDALADAGFTPQSPSRTPGFVCRLVGEPAASRSFDIPENPDYHEQCVNTPPTSAYWGYWYADNGGAWTYSTTGASGRRVIEGGFEGWRFSINSEGDPPMPGIAPRHSVEPSTPTTTPTHQPGGGGTTQPPSGPTSTAQTDGPGDATSSPGDDGPTLTAGPAKQGRDDATPTTSTPTPTASAGTSGVEVTSELPASAADDDAAGSATPTLIGAGVLGALGIGAAVTAWRRRRG